MTGENEVLETTSGIKLDLKMNHQKIIITMSCISQREGKLIWNWNKNIIFENEHWKMWTWNVPFNPWGKWTRKE